MQDSDEQVLDDWCARETHFWSRLSTGDRDFTGEFERLNGTIHSLFLLDIACGVVSVRPKPAVVASGVAIRPQEYSRVELYRIYLEDCVRLHAPQLVTTIALDVHDLPTAENHAPIFCFQKTVASRHMLLPDVDFMQHGWYETSCPELPYSAKKAHAVFVGSSTGGGNLSHADISEARAPRLRLAHDLTGNPRIGFSIAAAVQCESPQVEAQLRAQPYFSPPICWEAQLHSRLLISIDGNGATCSRVVNSLRSQSLLVKFSSPNRLFYFHGLEPWRHYVPVDTAGDIERVLDEEARGEIDTGYMIAEANAFYDRFLTRAAVHRYGAKLLLAYTRDVLGQEVPEQPAASEPAEAEPVAVDSGALHAVATGPVAGDYPSQAPQAGRMATAATRLARGMFTFLA